MEIINKFKKQGNGENNVDTQVINKDNSLFYIEKVETTFRTLDKALLDCLSATANHLLVSVGFESKQSSSILNLLNFLNQQHLSCKKFVDDYGKLKETL